MNNIYIHAYRKLILFLSFLFSDTFSEKSLGDVQQNRGRCKVGVSANWAVSALIWLGSEPGGVEWQEHLWILVWSVRAQDRWRCSCGEWAAETVVHGEVHGPGCQSTSNENNVTIKRVIDFYGERVLFTHRRSDQMSNYIEHNGSSFLMVKKFQHHMHDQIWSWTHKNEPCAIGLNLSSCT